MTEPMFSDLLKDIYPDSDLFLLKMEADIFLSWNKRHIVQIISQHRYGIPDQFDIIIISPSCQFQKETHSLFKWSQAWLQETGIIAGAFFGSDTFLELHTCLNWIENSISEQLPVAHFTPQSHWEKHMDKEALHLEVYQEDQFRKNYHNSQAVFQMAAAFGFFHSIEKELSNDGNHLLHNWMKAYDQGFRTKDGNVYTTYHVIELIGSFL